LMSSACEVAIASCQQPEGRAQRLSRNRLCWTGIGRAHKNNIATNVASERSLLGSAKLAINNARRFNPRNNGTA
jgi:hypothetical protein